MNPDVATRIGSIDNSSPTLGPCLHLHAAWGRSPLQGLREYLATPLAGDSHSRSNFRTPLLPRDTEPAIFIPSSIHRPAGIEQQARELQARQARIHQPVLDLAATSQMPSQAHLRSTNALAKPRKYGPAPSTINSCDSVMTCYQITEIR